MKISRKDILVHGLVRDYHRSSFGKVRSCFNLELMVLCMRRNSNFKHGYYSRYKKLKNQQKAMMSTSMRNMGQFVHLITNLKHKDLRLINQ
jgi:hypothetical protein